MSRLAGSSSGIGMVARATASDETTASSIVA